MLSRATFWQGVSNPEATMSRAHAHITSTGSYKIPFVISHTIPHLHMPVLFHVAVSCLLQFSHAASSSHKREHSTCRQEGGKLVLDIALSPDEAADYLNFVIKDAATNTWFDANGSNFQLALRNSLRSFMSIDDSEFVRLTSLLLFILCCPLTPPLHLLRSMSLAHHCFHSSTMNRLLASSHCWHGTPLAGRITIFWGRVRASHLTHST